MASLPPIKWPTGRTPSKVEIFLYEHKGGRVALHVADLDANIVYPAFLLEDMTGYWNSVEGWCANPFLWVEGDEDNVRILHFKGNPSTWEGVWQTSKSVVDVKSYPFFADTLDDGVDPARAGSSASTRSASKSASPAARWQPCTSLPST